MLSYKISCHIDEATKDRDGSGNALHHLHGHVSTGLTSRPLTATPLPPRPATGPLKPTRPTCLLKFPAPTRGAWASVYGIAATTAATLTTRGRGCVVVRRQAGRHFGVRAGGRSGLRAAHDQSCGNYHGHRLDGVFHLVCGRIGRLRRLPAPLPERRQDVQVQMSRRHTLQCIPPVDHLIRHG